MTATTDHPQVLCNDSLSGGLACTLPIGVSPSSAALLSPLKGDTQSRQPPSHVNTATEIAALVALATALGEAPHTVCQVLADKVLALLNAGSAGVSVLSVQSDGGVLVSWPAIAGRWQAHSGSSRLLLAPANPAATPEPTAEHYLVVPFGVAGETNGATGTVWAVAHDAALGFDAEDLRQLQNLALFASPALQAVAARRSAPTPYPAMPAPELHGAPDSQHGAFNSLIKNAPFGVYVVDAQFRLCQASAAARKAFASVQPLIGRDFGEVVRAVWPEPFASEVLAHFRRTLDSGKAHAQPTVNELRKDMPDAESYDWNIERIVLPDGAFGVLCYFYDLTELQQAAEALRLRTAQFETLFNEAPLGIYLVDADLRICQVNPVALPEFGNIPGLIGQDFATVMQTVWGPALADEIVQKFRNTLTTGEPFEAPELVALRADRSTVAYYEWQIHRIPLPDGSQGVACYFRDISTRVQAQAQILDSELRLRALVSASSDVVYRMNADWTEMRHLQGREFIVDTHEPNRSWLEKYIHPCDQQRVLDTIREAVRTKGLFELEHQVLRIDGTPGWTFSRAIPLMDKDGAVVEWFGMASDVTARKQAQEALRASEERQRLALDAAELGMWHVDPATYAIQTDARFREIFGTTEEFAEYGQLLTLIHPDDLPMVEEAVAAATRLKDPIPYAIEYRVVHPDGSVHWVFAKGRSNIDETGPTRRVMSFDGTVADITARKGIEADLIAALASAESANLAKSDFLSHMSHELRSPLNAVLGFAQLLQSGTPPPTARQEEGVGEILKAGWYLLGLIDEILDLSLIESGRLSCVLGPVPLAEVLDDCQAMIAGQAEARGIRLSLPRLEDGCIVIGDRTRLKQVFINILGNAIKYNREGGTVDVHCETVRQGRICIRFEDSGNGLSPKQLGHIFRPFERLGQESGAIEGTGIGLSLSKRLVELMGGRIGVHSVVDQGSVFWVELNTLAAQASAPASRPASATAQWRVAEAPGPAAVTPRPYTVLYVEDNRANQLLMHRLLEQRSDVSLLLAGDGEHGVQLAHEMQPDVVLMDINLPGLSGLEAMERLAADAATGHIPVIAVSALAMQHDIDRGLRAGFLRYLSKPIKIDALTEALDAALNLADLSLLPSRATAAMPIGMASLTKKPNRDHTP